MALLKDTGLKSAAARRAITSQPSSWSALERSGDVEEFRQKVVEFHQVLECHHVVGAFDYLLKVLVRTPDDTGTLPHGRA